MTLPHLLSNCQSVYVINFAVYSGDEIWAFSLLTNAKEKNVSFYAVSNIKIVKYWRRPIVWNTIVKNDICYWGRMSARRAGKQMSADSNKYFFLSFFLTSPQIAWTRNKCSPLIKHGRRRTIFKFCTFIDRYRAFRSQYFVAGPLKPLIRQTT